MRQPPKGHHALIPGVAFVSDGGEPVHIDESLPAFDVPEGDHEMTVDYWLAFALRELDLPGRNELAWRRARQAIRIARLIASEGGRFA